MRFTVCTLGVAAAIAVASLATRAWAVEVGGVVCADTTWTAAESPYIVTNTVIVGCGATLTIEPDVVVRFQPAKALIVGHASWGEGTLVARGAGESPIFFTSAIEPAPGDWSRIYFSDYATDAFLDPNGVYQSGCILEHVVVEYAGYGDSAAIFAEKSSPFLNYCEVRHNSYIGIKVDGANAPPIKIVNCEVWDHPEVGLYISNGSAHKLLDNHIHDNAGGMYFYNCPSNTLSGNTIAHNTATGTGGGIYFYHSGGNTLSGNTIADNTTSGNGGGIDFGYDSAGNTLSGNTIADNTARYGGGIWFYRYYGGASTLTENTISGNVATESGGGVYFDGAGGYTLIGNKIQHNTAGGEGGAIFLNNSDSNEFSSNLIRANHTELGQTGGIYVTNDTDWLSLAGDPNAQEYNVLCCNDGYQLYNNGEYRGDGSTDIDASYVQWCTPEPSVIEGHIFDCFDDASRACVVWYSPVEVNGLGAGDPPPDGTLAKTQNNVLTLAFDCPITLPGGAALHIVPLGGGDDLGDLFTYSATTTTCAGDTLGAVESGSVLQDMTWYSVTPADGFDVGDFAFDLCTLRGDAYSSGRVTTADYSEVKAHLGERDTDARYDLNGSGRVTTADYTVVKDHMGNRAPAKP